MDLMEGLLEGNRRYRESDFTKELADQSAVPLRRLAVVACMDARHVPERVLGLEPGEAKVIRSAGAVVDEGVLRSLVAAVHLLEVDTVVHMGHTDCGLKGLWGREDVLRERLDSCFDGIEPRQVQQCLAWLQPFEDVVEHAKDSVSRIRMHALLPKDLTVRALVYDNKTGAVETVV